MIEIPPHDDRDEVAGFVNADEVPEELLDPHPLPEEEGDDAVHEHGNQRLAARAPAATAPLPTKARARIVPFRRNVRLGTIGWDVVAVKRALSHAGYLKWPHRWSRTAGPVWRAAVKRFQKQHGLPVNGLYDVNTHRKLVTLGHFDKWGAHLMATAPRPHGEKSLQQRDKIAAAALWGYHNRDQIHYRQSRPIDGHRQPYKLPLTTDCSGFATDAYEWAGSRDPNGRGFDGEGYTGTLAQHGTPTVNIRTADLCFYGGRLPYHHVTIALGRMTCISHGSEQGPLLLPIRYRPDYNHTRDYSP